MCPHSQPASKQSKVIVDLTRRISDLEHLLAQDYVCASRLGAPRQILRTIQDAYQGKAVGNANILFDLEDFSGRLLERLAENDDLLIREHPASGKNGNAIVVAVETRGSDNLESKPGT